MNFTATGPELKDIQMLSWAFNPLSGTAANIYTAIGQDGKVNDLYKGRVNFYSSTKTLELKSLTAADSGTYTLSITINLETQLAQTVLQVLGRFHTDGLQITYFTCSFKKLDICLDLYRHILKAVFISFRHILNAVWIYIYIYIRVSAGVDFRNVHSV